MLKFIVNHAARLTVAALNGLVDRIDRAHQQVLRAQNKGKRGLNTATLGGKKPARQTSYRPSVMDTEAANSVLAKMNVGRAKDLQHHIPTSRHS